MSDGLAESSRLCASSAAPVEHAATSFTNIDEVRGQSCGGSAGALPSGSSSIGSARFGQAEAVSGVPMRASSERSLEQMEESYLSCLREKADMQPCSEASERRRKGSTTLFRMRACRLLFAGSERSRVQIQLTGFS
jgi:hypothetical protein